MTPRGLVSVGVIVGAHGVKGEVKLKSFTGEPTGIASYGPLATSTGERFEIVRLRPGKDGFIAVLKGVTGRDQAEALKGVELYIARQCLPRPEKGQVYLRDLVGLAVMSGGARLGEVVAVHNYGAGDLLDVMVEGQKDTVLIPFATGFVVETDLAGGKIVVELPAGYLDEEVRQS
ncbi:MAG: ribosome maturation factor RimM [Hyphomicrobiales bacterium]